ncbi:hypothetical protein KBI23_22495 [bacterium]|nr:hypothetical protein [bacterium]MBP9810498.1 hypothetical protein [bacterium]
MNHYQQTASSVLAIAAVLVIVAPPAANAMDCWRLEQSSQIYGAGTVFSFGKEGFRWSNPANGVTITARAPEWKVQIYNAKTNRLFETPLNKYEGHMLRISIIFWGFSFPRIPFDEGPKEKVLGLQCRSFTMKKLTKKEKIEKGIDTLLDAKMLTTKDLPYPPQVLAFLRQQYNFPALGDLPLSFQLERKGKNRQFMLQTTKITKVNLSPAEFRAPAGSQRALNDKDVLRGSDENNSLDGLMQDINRKSF